MYLSEEEAKERWCPFARVEGSNRMFNTLSDGFKDSPAPYHCIAGECLAWREVHVTYLKVGTGKAMANHGYYGLAERPEFG
ncbi:MAG: hypothetical protein WDN01_08435 [Rhizomicrobium sp.]